MLKSPIQRRVEASTRGILVPAVCFSFAHVTLKYSRDFLSLISWRRQINGQDSSSRPQYELLFHQTPDIEYHFIEPCVEFFLLSVSFLELLTFKELSLKEVLHRKDANSKSEPPNVQCERSTRTSRADRCYRAPRRVKCSTQNSIITVLVLGHDVRQA